MTPLQTANGENPPSRKIDATRVVDGETWVDVLLPPASGRDPLFDALRHVEFRDGSEKLQLGALDQAIARLLFLLLGRPVTRGRPLALNIELPRGDHQVAILLGILTQVARMAAHDKDPGSPTDFPGSVTVIGMDTAVQRRLGEVKVQRMPLSEGLKAHRVRSDGRLAKPDGGSIPFYAQERRLLYLNTRVGWPKLRGEQAGVAIIDRSSFRNADIFRHALDWAKNHRVNLMIVVSDRGDTDTIETLTEHASKVFCWNVDGPIREQLRHVVGLERSRSQLSTNVLLGSNRPSPRITLIEAPAIESRLRRSFDLLKDAYELDAPLPYGVSAARRILYVLNQLVGTLDSFNTAAALDHRSRSIRSLANTVEGTSSNSFPREWHGYGSTRWETLRRLMLELVELVDTDNPKFMGMLATVDLVARRMPDHAIVIRTASEAAAAALVDDFYMFENDLPETERMTVLPWAERLPWTDRPTVEVLPALPPPSRRSLLWSSEATERILLTYGWEEFVLEQIEKQDLERIEGAIAHTFASIRLGPPPVWPQPSLTVFETVRGGPRPEEDQTLPELTVDLTPLIAGLDELDDALSDEKQSTRETPGRGALEVKACPLTLEPSGDIWWVPCDTAVDTLIAGSYRQRQLPDLKPGDQVIIPRGTGREDLFTRLVKAKYQDSDVRDLLVMMNRWRRACRLVISHCDGDLHRAYTLLEEAGCSTVTQIEAWADGSTIAPQRSEDIAAVAQVAGDEWLEKNWRRIAATATELRGLNISIGHNISGAMHEVTQGDGPHLRALARTLETNAEEILDEFDVAVLRAIGAPESVPAGMVGTVTKTSR